MSDHYQAELQRALEEQRRSYEGTTIREAVIEALEALLAELRGGACQTTTRT